MDQDVVSPDDERLLPLVAKIADGTPIDWSAVSSDNPSPSSGGSESNVVNQLRRLERLVRGHEACRAQSHNDDQADDTLLTLERRRRGASAETPVHVQWGPLVVLEKIGHGSSGGVYRAWDPRLDREVALKLIPAGMSQGSGSPVIEEGRLLARVRHPNVLTVHGAEYIDGRVGIWTEYVHGETLAQEVARCGPLHARGAARVGADVCAALTAVHGAGVLHCDVKAQNVLRESSGRIVLGDFGTGIEFDDESSPGERRTAGTPLYLAPELLAGGSPSARTDLYSVGVLLYFLVTGDFPVRGRTLDEIRQAHAISQGMSLRQAGPALDASFVAIVDALLDQSPDRRPRSAAAAEVLLRGWLEPQSFALVEPPRERTRRRGGALSATAAGLLIVAALVGWWKSNPAVTEPLAHPAASSSVSQAETTGSLNQAPEPQPALLNFEARDWVLITTFENRTGESLLDGTLEFALARELSNSAFVNVVPQERVEDVLQLMRRPVDTKLDLRLAREVAVRDGAIRAVISGRVEKIGPAYVVTSQIVAPADGTVVASLSEDAATSSVLLPAMRRQAFGVREALGEMLRSIRRSAAELQKVTTPSLHAAQLYSQAAAFLQGDTTFKPGPAEQLLTQAVALDPDFASAHILLAWATQFQNRPLEEYLEHATHALRLAGRSSDVERYFIVGSYHQLQSRALPRSDEAGSRDELRRAAAAFETLLRLKPDHFWGVWFLSNVYNALGQEPEATEMMIRRADLQPKNLPLRWWVVQRLFERRDLDRGWAQLRKAEALLTPAFTAEHPEYRAQIQQLEVAQAWLQHDVRQVRRLADDLSHTIVGTDLTTGSNLGVALNLVGIYNSLGRARDARRIAEYLPPDFRDEYVVRVLSMLANQGKPGAKDVLDAYLRGISPDLGRLPPTPLYASALVVTGQLDALRTTVAAAKRDGFVTFHGGRIKWFVTTAEARLALAEGRIDDAVRLFEETHALGGPALDQSVGVIVELANAWAARGETERAMHLLEQATRDTWANSASNASFSGYAVRVNEWVRARSQLADLLRASGREEEALPIEKELAQLLAVADDDSPLRLKLMARQREEVTAAHVAPLQ